MLLNYEQVIVETSPSPTPLPPTHPTVRYTSGVDPGSDLGSIRPRVKLTRGLPLKRPKDRPQAECSSGVHKITPV